jgi:hypothetical protein
MEARLRLPHSLSQPRPMRRPHNTGSEEPRRIARKRRSGGALPAGRPRAVAWRLLSVAGSLPALRYEGERVGALLHARLTIALVGL